MYKPYLWLLTHTASTIITNTAHLTYNAAYLISGLT